MEDADYAHQLSEDGEEYQQARHYLQACLINRGEVGRSTIWKITNATLQQRFDRRAKALLKISSLCSLSTDKIGSENKDVRKICTEGFDFRREGGLEFSTGVCSTIPAANLTAVTPESYTMVYSEVAVGRSLIVEEKLVITHAMPPEYDSFYIPQKPLDRNNDGMFDYDEFQAAANFDDRSPSEYYHRYFVKDPAQVLPKYVIEFSFAHRALASSSSSLSSSSSSSAGLFGTKKPNPDDQVGYFDPVLFKPVTVGEYRRSKGRQLQTIDEAYEQAKADLKKPDVLVKARRDWIEQQLAELDERCRQVNLNMASVRGDIEASSARVIKELNAACREKFEALLGVEIELNRQREQLDWLDEVMKQSRQTAEAKLEQHDGATEAQVRFLQAWQSHTVLRNSLARMKAIEVNVLKKVVPDITLHAASDFRVWLDPHWQHNRAAGGDFGPSGESKQSDLWRTLSTGVREGHYSVPARPKHDLLVPTLQGIVDLESERIQHALEAAKKDASIALPPSLQRPAAAGAVYKSPLAAMLTASNPAVVHMPGADPRTKFNDVLTSYVGRLTDKTRTIDISSAATLPTPAPSSSSAASANQPPIPSNDQADAASDFASPAISRKVTVAVQQPERPAQAPAPTSPSSGVQLPLSALQKIADRHTINSSRKNTQTKKRRMEGNRTALQDFAAGAATLAASSLLQLAGDATEAAENIYFSLPAAKKAATLKCIYDTKVDPRGLNFLVDRGVVNRRPWLLLVQSEDFVFGAYLSHPLEYSGAWSGSPACFLFSSTLSLKLPYHGRHVSEAQAATGSPTAFCVDRERMIFGNGDLVIDKDLLGGSSYLEQCYGTGLTPGSTEANCLLAGRAEFPITNLEVWTVMR